MSRYYAYVLTINNPTADEVWTLTHTTFLVDHLMKHGATLVHAIIGDEGTAGPNDKWRSLHGYKPKTRHFQCAFWFGEKHTFKEVKAMFPRAFIERVKYHYLAAVLYCKKEEQYVQHGCIKQALDKFNEIMPTSEPLRGSRQIEPLSEAEKEWIARFNKEVVPEPPKPGVYPEKTTRSSYVDIRISDPIEYYI